MIPPVFGFAQIKARGAEARGAELRGVGGARTESGHAKNDSAGRIMPFCV